MHSFKKCNKTRRRVFLVTAALSGLAVGEEGRESLSLGEGKREKI